MKESRKVRTNARVQILAIVVSVMIVFAIAIPVSATVTTLNAKFTAQGLGLGTEDINKGQTVDADMAGLITLSDPGKGSVLSILADGKAGNATVLNPLLVTITAQSHLDTDPTTIPGYDSNLDPYAYDYYGAALFISKEKNDTPDGKKEGMGVRSWTVNETTGIRQLGDNDRGKLEGSKHVSGGTGPEDYDENKNGPPHVDDAVRFDFNPAFNVEAQSIVLTLSDFKRKTGHKPEHDIIDLTIHLTSGVEHDLQFINTTSTAVYESVGGSDEVFKFKFSGLSVLNPGDKVDWFTVFGDDDVPSEPKGTAEHFFVAAMTAGYTPVPEPATMSLLAIGGLTLIRRKKRS